MGTSGPVILAPAGGLTAALAAITEGATLIDLWEADLATAEVVRAHHPAAAICAPAAWAGLVRDLAMALRTGAVLICAGRTGATAAQAAGIGRDRLLVEAPPAEVTGLLAAGWPVLVAADEAGPHTAAATGAMASWLNAAAVRTSYVTAVRRAIAMTEAIRGTRPRRGGCAPSG
jgi:hypothetical protein